MKKYTLLELMVAMLIFVIMMGILTTTFGAASDISTSESVKVNLMNDANMFYDYLTSDLQSAVVTTFEAPENTDGDPRDVENLQVATDPAENTDRHLDFVAGTSISFYSNVAPYTDTNLVDSLDINPPYITYLFSGSEILRTMDDSHVSGGASPVTGTLLEGVTAFSFQIWSDFAGGNPLTTTGITETPACITFTITIESPSPYGNPVDKAKNARTITKTIYLN